MKKLYQICEYVKDKIEVSELDRIHYISTENMVSNKGGITEAASLPSTMLTQKFSRGDVLVSNIRPYFKKIWFAEFNGGCSNDVLVFRSGKDITNEFLYYILSDDKFFEYSMHTSKGTKMPRGDKNAIMEYLVPDFGIEMQKKVTSIMQYIDEKIKLNSKLNENLAA